MAKYLDSIGLSKAFDLIKNAIAGKQDTLVSGTNIKTINNTSLLGSGDIQIGGSGTIPDPLSVDDVEAGNSITVFNANGAKVVITSHTDGTIYITEYGSDDTPAYRWYLSSLGNLARQAWNGSSFNSPEYFAKHIDIAPKFVVETKTATIGAVSASGTKWVTVTCSKSGYTFIGPVGWYLNGAATLTVYALRKSAATSCQIALRNPGSSATSSSATVEIEALFVKNS